MKKKSIFFFLMLFVSIFTLTLAIEKSRSEDPGTLRKFPDPVFISSSALPRTSPIAITDDSDFSTYASSGDGSISTPWIIEDFLIECNDTGIGIGIQDTEDYFIIRNGYINESEDTGSTFNLVLNNVTNCLISNVTCDQSGGTNVGIFRSYNNTVTNCNFTNSGGNQDTFIDSSYNITIEDSFISNGVTSIIIDNFIYGVDSHDITLDNISFSNTTSKHISISEGHNFTVINNNFTDSNKALDIENTEDSNISNNYIADNTWSGIEIQNGDNITVSYNTIENSTRAIYMNTTLSTSINIKNNNVEDNNNGILGILGSSVISNNTFNDSINPHIELTGSSSDNSIRFNVFGDSNGDHIGSLGTNDVLQNNIWLDYFEHYPNAKTTSIDSITLDTVYSETGVSTNDLLPLYDPQHYPRNDQIEILVRRTVDWTQIIPDEWIYYHLDGLTVLNTTNINAVLYRITIEDLFGHVGFDQQYNINETEEPLIQVEIWKISLQNRLEIPATITVRSNGQKLDYTVENNTRQDIWVLGGFDYDIFVIDDDGKIWFDDIERLNTHLRLVLTTGKPEAEVFRPIDLPLSTSTIIFIAVAIGSSTLLLTYLARRNGIRSPGKYRGKIKRRKIKPRRKR